ncbi:hypothetical protein MIR68_008069 [Amoeboaphelidium protococcarum]|nr:hypothetical protein MIR68_008069 [Amoeboaphelidium protococcarum]
MSEVNEEEVQGLLEYLNSLQPKPEQLINELEEKQLLAYQNWFFLTREQLTQKYSLRGHDIFQYLVESQNKALKTVYDAVNITLKECRVGVQRSGQQTTTSVSKKYPDITQLDLRVWADFDQGAVDFIAQVPDQKFGRNVPLAKDQFVYSEVEVQSEYVRRPLDIISECCQSLSGHESYAYFGSNCGFLFKSAAKVMGDPDLVWATNRYEGLPKLTVELKTPWAIKSLVDLIPRYNQEYVDFETRKQRKQKRTDAADKVEKGKIIRAVEQVYVYMALNRHRYGVLTTFNETVFLRRVEDPEQEGRSVLECSPVIKCSQRQPYTLVAAWIYLLSLIESSANDWMHASPHSSKVVSPALIRKARVVNYQSVDLNAYCHWTNIIYRGRFGAVAIGNYADEVGVIFKTVDLSKKPDALEQFNNEVEVYKALESLQGTVIPRFIAYGTLCSMLLVIVLENVGQSMTTEQCSEREADVQEALDKIHALGYRHGDLRPANMTVDSSGRVRIIDFEMAEKADGRIVEFVDLDLD